MSWLPDCLTGASMSWLSDRCMSSGWKIGKDSMSANEACCACGGGIRDPCADDVDCCVQDFVNPRVIGAPCATNDQCQSAYGPFLLVFLFLSCLCMCVRVIVCLSVYLPVTFFLLVPLSFLLVVVLLCLSRLIASDSGCLTRVTCAPQLFSLQLCRV